MQGLQRQNARVKRIGDSFVVQPIIDGFRRIYSIELLRRRPPDSNGDGCTIDADILALQSAIDLSHVTATRTHCNAEIISLIDGAWLNEACSMGGSRLTIEIVERHAALNDSMIWNRLQDACSRVRKIGASIALDDFTGTNIELELIKILKPEIVKIDSPDLIATVKKASATSKVVLERVETEACALASANAGVEYLQGFWCDRIIGNQLPPSLETAATAAATEAAISSRCQERHRDKPPLREPGAVRIVS